METYAVRITDDALNQMQEIVQYIAETLQAPEAAQRLLDTLYAEMEKCGQFPARHPLLREEPWRSRGIRRIIVKNFYAYYWTNETNRQVWFLAVIYARRDQGMELRRMLMK